MGLNFSVVYTSVDGHLPLVQEKFARREGVMFYWYAQYSPYSTIHLCLAVTLSLMFRPKKPLAAAPVQHHKCAPVAAAVSLQRAFTS